MKVISITKEVPDLDQYIAPELPEPKIVKPFKDEDFDNSFATIKESIFHSMYWKTEEGSIVRIVAGDKLTDSIFQATKDLIEKISNVYKEAEIWNKQTNEKWRESEDKLDFYRLNIIKMSFWQRLRFLFKGGELKF